MVGTIAARFLDAWTNHDKQIETGQMHDFFTSNTQVVFPLKNYAWPKKS
jgi:hypothetical protein